MTRSAPLAHTASFILLLALLYAPVGGFSFAPSQRRNQFHKKTIRVRNCSAPPRALSTLLALSDAYLENDLVSVKVPDRLLVKDETSSDNDISTTRLCVVRPDATVAPLCRHEDDVDTDLFVDPRTMEDAFWQDVTDDAIVSTYGEGWYGQRPVPSLGGGPG